MARFCFLAGILLLWPISGWSQHKALGVVTVARVRPDDRANFEYELLVLMRAQSPVTPQGAGSIAAVIADCAARGKLARDDALTIARLVTRFYRVKDNQRAAAFSELKKSVATLLNASQLNRRDQLDIYKTLQLIQ